MNRKDYMLGNDPRSFREGILVCHKDPHWNKSGSEYLKLIKFEMRGEEVWWLIKGDIWIKESSLYIYKRKI